MRKMILGLSLAAVAAPVTPVLADPPPWAPAHGRRAKEAQYRGDYYAGPVWQGRDGRTYCRRKNGTTGLIVGAAGGALLGRAIDGGRNRTTGTVLGAAAGALLGREIDRGARCR